MDWKHIMNIASGHSSLVVRTPYPIVCWVSIENRKHDVNVKMLDTHGIQPFSAENKFSCWNLHNFKSRHIGTTSGEKIHQFMGTDLDAVANAFPPNRHAWMQSATKWPQTPTMKGRNLMRTRATSSATVNRLRWWKCLVENGFAVGQFSFESHCILHFWALLVDVFSSSFRGDTHGF